MTAASTEEYWDIDGQDVEAALGLSNKGASANSVLSFNKKQNGKGKYKKKARPHANAAETYDDHRRVIDKSASCSNITFEQKRALTMMVAFDYTDKQVAATLNRSVATIKNWKRKKAFKRALYARHAALDRAAMDRRKDVNDIIIDELQQSIMLAVHRGELHRMPIDRQIKLLQAVAKESRLDDPAAATSRDVSVSTVEETRRLELVAIQERFSMVKNRLRLKEARAATIDADYEVIREHQPAEK